jgi:SAM-dependent methyltransferase
VTSDPVDPEAVRRRWADRTGEFSPSYYAYRGPNEASEAVARLIDRHAGPDASVLELGCSSGRHLAHLRRADVDVDVDALAGVELNPDAFDVMADAYPELAADGSFRVGAIEEHLPEFEEDGFDVVFSVETLQHVHPEAAAAFDEAARVAGELLITVENESEAAPGTTTPRVRYVDDFPLFYRDWNAVFTDRGLVEVAATETKRDTVRAFRPD